MNTLGVWNMAWLQAEAFENSQKGCDSYDEYVEMLKDVPPDDRWVIVVYDPSAQTMELPNCYFREYVMSSAVLTCAGEKYACVSGIRPLLIPAVGDCAVHRNTTRYTVVDMPDNMKAPVDIASVKRDIDADNTSVEAQYTPLAKILLDNLEVCGFIRLADVVAIEKTAPEVVTHFQLLNTAGTEDAFKDAEESMDYIHIAGDNWSPLHEMNTFHICTLIKYHGANRTSNHINDKELTFLGKLPERSSKKSAGYDFCMPYAMYHGVVYRVEYTLAVGGVLNIKTGVTFRCADDQYLQILPRHSVAIKKRIRLTNTAAVIDADFAGNNIGISLECSPVMRSGAVLVSGDRVAQGIIRRYEVTDDDTANQIRKGSSFF